MKSPTRVALCAVLGLIALLAPGVVRADDTFTLFYVNGTSPTETLSGTMVIDTTLGMVDITDLTLTGAFDSSLNSSSDSVTSGYYRVEDDNITETVTSSVLLFFPTADLIGYGGGEICDTTNPCPGTSLPFESTYLNSVTDIVTLETTTVVGAFTTVYVTTEPTGPTTAPEPSALALLVVGLVGLMGMAWRRNRLA
jgi:PEP-CTERM motif